MCTRAHHVTNVIGGRDEKEMLDRAFGTGGSSGRWCRQDGEWFGDVCLRRDCVYLDRKGRRGKGFVPCVHPRRIGHYGNAADHSDQLEIIIVQGFAHQEGSSRW